MFLYLEIIIYLQPLLEISNNSETGELAEWSNAAVLKTVDCNRSGGSNPSFSAKGNPQRLLWVFCFPKNQICLRVPFLMHEVNLSFNVNEN